MIQIQHEHPPDTWKSLEPRAKNQSGTSNPWYVGYFGRYTLDLEESTVIHHVEGGTILHFLDTDQRRPFSLAGDRLLIGKPGSWERELVRVK